MIRRSRSRVAAAAVMAVLAVTGPGDPARAADASTTAAAQSKLPTWGDQRPDKGPVRTAPAGLRACMTRNDDVIPWRTTNIDRKTRWHADHRQYAHELIHKGIYRYFRETRVRTGVRVWSGFLGYDLDPANARLVMQVDPTVIDLDEFRSTVRKVARQANKDAKVKGRKVTVAVQEGCFSARKLNRLRKVLYDDRRYETLYDAGVELDGRYHGVFCGKENRAYARKLQQRVGPLLAVLPCEPGGVVR